MTPRTSRIDRSTRETSIEIELTLDGRGDADLATGLGFLDHMLHQLAFHGRFDLRVQARGDLHIDDHHTVEDTALALGAALDAALGDRAGIARFAHAYAPLDESLARVVIDLGGRAHASIALGLTRERLGDVSTENLAHFFRSFASAARATLHVDVLRGENDHHRVEAAFKALALALRAAVARDGGTVPSTKGAL